MPGRRWLPLAVLAAVAAIAIVAIGRDRPVTAADLRDARVVVDRYLDAYQRHDGAAICATLTPRVRRQIARSDDPRACARQTSRWSRDVRLVPRGRPTATLRPGREAGTGGGIYVTLDWPDGSGVGIGMQRVDGRWLLDSDQTCVTPSCQP
ncbi:MAG: hypothetical protein ACTHOE_03420 [Conexibacter sp.]